MKCINVLLIYFRFRFNSPILWTKQTKVVSHLIIALLILLRYFALGHANRKASKRRIHESQISDILSSIWLQNIWRP